MTRGVVILGSTGSIGTQALDVISRHPDEYRVVALAAGGNRELLAEQARAFGVGPGLARSGLDEPGVLAELAAHPDADVVLNAVVGFAGLPATIAALEAGKRLALANKESLIAAGPVVAPLSLDPAAGERQLIRSAVILAKHLYRPVRRRFPVAIELCQPLFARCHVFNLHCRACKQ